MSINKKELSRLSPEERIKRLKLLEEERKKEVNEIELLIKESMQEIKTDKLAEEIAPEQKAVDISRLFETTGEQRLERTAREEALAATFVKGTRGYTPIQQVEYTYSQVNRLNSALSAYGALNNEEKRLVGEIGERLTTAERYMTESEKVASKLNATKAVLYKLMKETGLF